MMRNPSLPVRANDTGIIGLMRAKTRAVTTARACANAGIHGAALLAMMVSSDAIAQAGVGPVCQGSSGYAAAAAGARTFIWRPEWLTAQRARVAADPQLQRRWRTAANAALQRQHRSVMDKGRVAASGDLHDYHSIGPYWWPTVGAPGGLPYVRRDGEVNPERSGEAFDHSAFQQLHRDVRLLALAYHHLGDRRYAERAAALLRLWFVDPATRMNPNFDHAQAIPGVNTGRPEGIIEAIALPDIVESIGVIAPANVLTAADDTALRAWFLELVQWMASSENGRAERRATNNHGIYYDYLISHFALFARLEPIVSDMVDGFPEQRLAVQMAADGSLPAELSRTRPFHYSVFAMDAAGRLAALGDCVGRDLWSAESANGRSLALGLRWIGPAMSAPAQWTRGDSDFASPQRRDRETVAARQVLHLFQWAGQARAWPGAQIADDVVGELQIPPPPAN